MYEKVIACLHTYRKGEKQDSGLVNHGSLSTKALGIYCLSEACRLVVKLIFIRGTLRAKSLHGSVNSKRLMGKHGSYRSRASAAQWTGHVFLLLLQCMNALQYQKTDSG